MFAIFILKFEYCLQICTYNVSAPNMDCVFASQAAAVICPPLLSECSISKDCVTGCVAPLTASVERRGVTSQTTCRDELNAVVLLIE